MGKTAPLLTWDRILVLPHTRSISMTPAIVGLDLAKNVFHVHVADPSGMMLESTKLAHRDVLSFFRPLPSSLTGI